MLKIALPGHMRARVALPVAAVSLFVGCAGAPVKEASTSAGSVVHCFDRVMRTSPQCAGGSVRSYSQDDMKGTGQTNPGAALQQLDPSFTVHR